MRRIFVLTGRRRRQRRQHRHGTATYITNEQLLRTGTARSMMASSSLSSSLSSSWKEFVSNPSNNLNQYWSLSSSSSSSSKDAMGSNIMTMATTTTITTSKLPKKNYKHERKLKLAVERAVRDRLKQRFAREFADDNDNDNNNDMNNNKNNKNNNESSQLSSFRTLLALNGFQRIVTPSGNNSRLYLAEGVVAVPPRRSALSLLFSDSSSFDYYSDFARRNNININIGAATTNDQIFAQPINKHSQQLHPDDNDNDNNDRNRNRPLTSTSAYSTSFPTFVQDDITLYRLVENSAAKFLDRRYSSVSGWTQRRFIRPFQDAKYRTRVAIKSANSMRQKVHKLFEKSLLEQVVDRIIIKNSTMIAVAPPPTTTTTPSMYPIRTEEIATDNNSGDSDSQEEKMNTRDENGAGGVGSSSNDGDSNNDDDDDDDPLETLMVVSSRPKSKHRKIKQKCTSAGNIDDTNDDDDDEVVVSATLYRRMTPSTRILALPDYYVLRHSSASTLVSVSLVVFGALPLAYRSYIFSIDYDWLVGSGTIAASVIATVTYGILSTRWRARTSQSRTVADALYRRVYARDDAAFLLLREGAIRSITKSILDSYYYYDHDHGNGNDDFPPSTSDYHLLKRNNNNNISSMLVDPMEWAIDFGLLQPSNDSDDVISSSSSSSSECNAIQKKRSQVGGPRRWKAVPFEDVAISLKS